MGHRCGDLTVCDCMAGGTGGTPYRFDDRAGLEEYVSFR